MTQNDEAGRGNIVAHRVWRWLQEKKRISFVPWVLNPTSESYDPVKVAVQKSTNEILEELEALMKEDVTK